MSQSYSRSLPIAYGFDEVAIVPGDFTINPEQVDISTAIGELRLAIPFLASAMDAIVDPAFAIAMGKLGGLAVLNLEGVQTKYADPTSALSEIVGAAAAESTAALQRLYAEPVKEKLIGQRVQEIKRGGVPCAVSVTPANTKRLASLAVEAGADIIFVQSTVTTARHVSSSPKGLVLSELCRELPVPVVVGNTVSYSSALELMETGIAGLLVGVGPGAACTTRDVLGVGVPQVTATMNCAAARDDYFKESGRYVAIITDGGMRIGGDVCKAIAAGADAVMLGTPFAQTQEAPGRGYNWGMATPDPGLPRGTRVQPGAHTTLKELLFGPSHRTDGTLNLASAVRSALGICGAANLKEMHRVQMVIAPAIKTEGKIFQLMAR